MPRLTTLAGRGTRILICHLFVVLMLGAALAQPARAFDTSARAAMVLDVTTGTILLEKNADQPMPPASMSKLMTLYMAFEAIRGGRLTLDERLPVSRHAMSYGGSTMFLDTTDRVRVEDLLRGIIVLSGNDACAVIAEALSPDGTEAGFARQMTQRAQQMGMTNSVFMNSNGWPAPGHVMSARDLALLAQRLLLDFPEFYPMFAEETFAFDGRAPRNNQNRNPLLGLGIGADGLKTGHTEEAGYGLVGSAKQGDRRIVFVLSGLDTTAARAEQSEAVVNWAFRQFTQRTLAEPGQVIAQADVWMGDAPRVDLVAPDGIEALIPVLSNDNVTAELVYDGPLNAPIAQGDQVAELVLTLDDLPENRIALVAGQDVARGGFVPRVTTAAKSLITRLIKGPEDGA